MNWTVLFFVWNRLLIFTWPAKHNIKIKTINSNRRIILDSQVNMLLDAKTKVTWSREIITTQFIFTNLQFKCHFTRNWNNNSQNLSPSILFPRFLQLLRREQCNEQQSFHYVEFQTNALCNGLSSKLVAVPSIVPTPE